MVPLLWKAVWRFFRKLHVKLPEDPTIPLLGTVNPCYAWVLYWQIHRFRKIYL